MIEEIEFEDIDKKIDISIDNEHQQIPICAVKKYQTFINLNQSLNTPLKENIVVDAFLYHLPYNTSFTTSQIKKSNIVDIDGIVTITIYNNDNIYYQNDIIFKHGYINDVIQNKLPLGEYRATIEYKGNKYFQPTILDIHFNVEKRLVDVSFNQNIYYGDPSHNVQVSLTLTDRITRKPIPKCQIQYVFNDEIFTNISDLNGKVTLNIIVPDTDKSHCLPYLLNNDDMIKTYTYPNVSYGLSVYSDNESYAINDAFVNVVANKLSTMVTVNTDTIINNNIVTISGKAITTESNENVKYGSVVARIPDANYETQLYPVSSNDDGNFTIDINFVDVYDFSSEIETAEPYDTAYDKITYINVNNYEEEIEVGSPIIINANVKTDMNDINDYVTDGMVVFILSSQNKELYRYGTEIDSIGQAVFLFNTSRTGTYDIEIQYYGIFGYSNSNLKITNITVIEHTENE